jgi:hypothetical protein
VFTLIQGIAPGFKPDWRSGVWRWKVAAVTGRKYVLIGCCQRGVDRDAIPYVQPRLFCKPGFGLRTDGGDDQVCGNL